MARLGRGEGRGLAGMARQLPAGETPAKSATVYTLGPDKKLTPMRIRTGISDGRFTHVVSGSLKEGDQVVIGVATSKVETTSPMGGPGGAATRPGGRR